MDVAIYGVYAIYVYHYCHECPYDTSSRYFTKSCHHRATAAACIIGPVVVG